MTIDSEVVGGLKGGQAALDKVCETQPDVTIIDIRMPETSGIKTIEYLLQACPSTRILVLTECDDPAYALSALASGALGYMSKRAAASDLPAAIRSVHKGHYFVDPVLASPLLQDFLRKRATRPPAAGGAPSSLLSSREREVLILLAQGYTKSTSITSTPKSDGWYLCRRVFQQTDSLPSSSKGTAS